MEKILIIDDSPTQIQALRNILENDYQIEVCYNGYSGIQKAKECNPSLILLDVIMPEINGFEVLQKLKEDESTKNIPIIFTTSLSDNGHEEKGLTLGAVDYITKPFHSSIVKARIKTHTELFAYRRTFENLAMLDSLTGIPNRRNYDERCLSEWFRAVRDKTPISIAILDIDYFKQYNDRYGHPCGDYVLKRISETLRNSLRRASDFVARYGGEEFVLLLPNTPHSPGKRIAEEICTNVESLQILHEDSLASGFVTVSIGGITVIPNQQDKYDFFFSIADKMLYKAKTEGRNTVVWAYEGNGTL